MVSDNNYAERLLKRMTAEHEIARALMAISRGTDTLDADLVRSGYHPNSTHTNGQLSIPGDTFGDFIVDRLPSAGYVQTSHLLSNIWITFDGDEVARVSSQFLSKALRVDGEHSVVVTVVGRYDDSFSRRDGLWAIDARTVRTQFDHETEHSPV